MERMVKGMNRQVIVVRSPDPKLFDEAIFLLRQEAADAPPQQIIRQAQLAADGYLRACAAPADRRSPGTGAFLLGAGLASLLWGALWLLVRVVL